MLQPYVWWLRVFLGMPCTYFPRQTPPLPVGYSLLSWIFTAFHQEPTPGTREADSETTMEIERAAKFQFWKLESVYCQKAEEQKCRKYQFKVCKETKKSILVTKKKKKKASEVLKLPHQAYSSVNPSYFLFSLGPFEPQTLFLSSSWAPSTPFPYLSLQSVVLRFSYTDTTRASTHSWWMMTAPINYVKQWRHVSKEPLAIWKHCSD